LKLPDDSLGPFLHLEDIPGNSLVRSARGRDRRPFWGHK